MPLSVTVKVPPVEELLENAIVPLAAPTIKGVKLTWTVRVCPGFKVAGNAAPVIEKEVPDNAAELTTTGAVPEDVTVRFCVDFEFNSTLPKLALLELTVSWGNVPLPFTFTTVVPPYAPLLEIVTVPVALPATRGR